MHKRHILSLVPSDDVGGSDLPSPGEDGEGCEDDGRQDIFVFVEELDHWVSLQTKERRSASQASRNGQSLVEIYFDLLLDILCLCVDAPDLRIDAPRNESLPDTIGLIVEPGRGRVAGSHGALSTEPRRGRYVTRSHARMSERRENPRTLERAQGTGG